MGPDLVGIHEDVLDAFTGERLVDGTDGLVVAPQQPPTEVHRRAAALRQLLHRRQRPPGQAHAHPVRVGEPPDPGRTGRGRPGVGGAEPVDQRDGVPPPGQLRGRGEPPRPGPQHEDLHRRPTPPARREDGRR